MSTEHLLGDLGAILDALMGMADQPRQEAEQHLRRLTLNQPGEVLLVLAQVGAQGVGGFQIDHRFLTSLLLKRLAFRPLPGLFLNQQAQVASSPFDVIAERVRGRIETVLCAGVKDEMNVRMRKGLANCAAGWAQESAKRQRPFLALPPVLLQLTAHSNPFHRFTPFQILDLAPTLLVDSVSDPVPAEQLAQLLLAGLHDASVDVRLEAVKAMRSVLLEGVTGREREVIGSSLVGEAFNSLPRLPAELLSHALLPLVDLASLHPNLFLPHLPTILPYLLSLLSPPSAALPSNPAHPFSPYPPSSLPVDTWEEVANPATEIILCLAELRRAQVLGWEEGRAVREMVGLLVGRQVVAFGDQSEGCQEWLEETELDEEDEDYPAFSEEMLDRLAHAVGGEPILGALSEHVQALLQHPDWRCRYCSLVGIASVVEGCLEAVQPILPDVLKLIWPLAKDQHPRVRYAFLQCLGQLCTDCEGVVQRDYAKDVLDICLELLADQAARVRAHAAACLTNFFGQAEPDAFLAHLQSVVGALYAAFQAGPLYVQEQVFATMSAVVSQAEEAFVPFYREAMALAFRVLEVQSKDEQHYKLVGRAMECASIIGVYVPKTTFAGDAVRLAQIMISLQNEVSSIEDPRNGYLMEAWSNVCRALGKDFNPFLQHVLPPLLKAAAFEPASSAPPALGMTDDDEQAESTADAYTAHTAELDEKVLAFENLTVYAFTVRAAFAPWLGECMQLSLKALSFEHSEDVREAAAFLVPALLQVAKDANAWSSDPAALEKVFQTMINTIAKEADYTYLALLFKSLTDSLHVISTPLPATLLAHLFKTTTAHLTDLFSRRQDRQAQAPYMDEGDRELYLEEQAEEDACLDEVSKLWGMLLQVHGEAVRGTVDELWKRVADVRSMGLDDPEH